MSVVIWFYLCSVPKELVTLHVSLTGISIERRISCYIRLNLSSYFCVGQPDIAAPGVQILAATSPLDPAMDGGYGIKSGTSMATPHVSGIVALLKALHPNWSPAAIKSALITTGNPALIPFIKQFCHRFASS